MKRIFLVSLVLILLSATVAAFGCGDGGNGEEAELPTLNVGNKWVYKWVSNEAEYTCNREVKGDDTSYVVQLSFDPPLSFPDSDPRCGVVSEGTEMLDKATCLPTKMQGEGTSDGESGSVVLTYTYSFENQLWPLKVGKEVASYDAQEFQGHSNGEECKTDEEGNCVYKVEAMEEITVAAGTFECFKVVKYDIFDNKMRTWWYCETVKNEVKWIDHETGDTAELQSYSV